MSFQCVEALRQTECYPLIIQEAFKISCETANMIVLMTFQFNKFCNNFDEVEINKKTERIEVTISQEQKLKPQVRL